MPYLGGTALGGLPVYQNNWTNFFSYSFISLQILYLPLRVQPL